MKKKKIINLMIKCDYKKSEVFYFCHQNMNLIQIFGGNINTFDIRFYDKVINNIIEEYINKNLKSLKKSLNMNLAKNEK